MDQGWTGFIYEVRSGNIEIPVELTNSSATRLITGQGTGSHAMRTGRMSPALIRELSEGNKYGIAIGWADDPTYCGYAGVIQDRDLDDDSMTCEVRTRELPAAMFGDRSFFGVNQYQAGQALVVEGKSPSGAVRAFLAACMSPSDDWKFPIDLPPDGAGTFKGGAKHEETATLASLLQSVRDLGVEIDFRPYFVGDQVRHQTRVARRITHGSALDLAVRAPGSRVTKLKRQESWAGEKTGVLAFGNGQGAVRPWAYAPLPPTVAASGGSVVAAAAVPGLEKPVRDSFVTFPDIKVPEGDVVAQAQLQQAATEEWLRHRGSVETTPFEMHIWGMGPRTSEPGQLLNLWSYGGLALDDGMTPKRVTGVRIDLSTRVTPEVETYAA